MSEKPTKSQYRIRNWSEYNAALKNRGSLTFWVEEELLNGWLNAQKTGKRGASQTYSDPAIATMSTIGSLFDLAGRQTQGFIESLFLVDGSGFECARPLHCVKKTGKIKR